MTEAGLKEDHITKRSACRKKIHRRALMTGQASDKQDQECCTFSSELNIVIVVLLSQHLDSSTDVG